MKRTAMMKYLAAIVLTLLVMASCASLSPKQVSVPENLDTYEGLSTALAAGEDILLYDVREPEEYESGHIPGALNFPDYEFLKNPPPLKKDDIIVLYCVSGLRSTSVHKMLTDNGYKYVYDFGGLWKWEGELVKSD